MIKLTQDQIDLVTEWLNNEFDWDDDSYFHGQSSPVVGADFEFEGSTIVNPFFDETGSYLGQYEAACEYYGEDLVNQYFLTVANNLENKYKETFLESVIDNYNKDIIYEDDKIKVISTDIESSLLSQLDQSFPDHVINHLFKVNDPIILIGFKSDNDGDDFIFENDTIIAISPLYYFNTAILTDDHYSPFNNIEYLDELYQIIKEGKLLPKDLWPVLLNTLIEEPYLSSCLDSSGNYGNADIPWSSLHNLKLWNNSFSDLDTILDGSVLGDPDFVNSFSDVVFRCEAIDFIDYIDDKSWDVLTETFKLSKDDIINELEKNSTAPAVDEISSLILQCAAHAVLEDSYKQYLRIIHNELKKALPEKILPYTTFNNIGITITKCPINILKDIMLDYVNLNIHRKNAQDIIDLSLSDLIDNYIIEYLYPDKVTRLLENTNTDVDIEEFNSCIQQYA